MKPDVLYARKLCWLDLEGLPVCDKRRESLPREKAKDPSWQGYDYGAGSHCTGCERWLQKHPEELVPR